MKRKNAIRKVTGKGRKKRAGPDRPKEKRLMPRRPKPGGRFQPKPRPGDRMVLPPRPRKNPRPKLPKATMELTPEQRRRLMHLLKRTPDSVRKKKLLSRVRKMK